MRRYAELAGALAATLGPAHSAAADDSCASPAEPPVLAPGQAICNDFGCADIHVWIDGRPVGIVPPVGVATQTAQCADREKEMVVRLMPPSIPEANSVARVDADARSLDRARLGHRRPLASHEHTQCHAAQDSDPAYHWSPSPDAVSPAAGWARTARDVSAGAQVGCDSWWSG